MDQQAKKHLQEEFDAALEEKDQMITVLQTQVRPPTRQYFYIFSRKAPYSSFDMFLQVALLKKRMKGGSDVAVPLEEDANQAENSAKSSTQSPSKEQGEEPEAPEGIF